MIILHFCDKVDYQVKVFFRRSVACINVCVNKREQEEKEKGNRNANIVLGGFFRGEEHEPSCCTESKNR